MVTLVVVVVTMQEIGKKKSEIRKMKQKGNNIVSIECLPHALGTY